MNKLEGRHSNGNNQEKETGRRKKGRLILCCVSYPDRDLTVLSDFSRSDSKRKRRDDSDEDNDNYGDGSDGEQQKTEEQGAQAEGDARDRRERSARAGEQIYCRIMY